MKTMRVRRSALGHRFKCVGGMHQLLYAVNGDRRRLALDRQQALHAENGLAMPMQEQRQPEAEGGPIDRLIENQMEGFYIVSVAIGVMFVMAVLGTVMRMRDRLGAVIRFDQSLGLDVEPAPNLMALAFQIEEIVAEDLLRVEIPRGGAEYRRRGIYATQPSRQSVDLGRLGDIRLRDGQPIRDRGLFHGFGLMAQLP